MATKKKTSSRKSSRRSKSPKRPRRGIESSIAEGLAKVSRATRHIMSANMSANARRSKLRAERRDHPNRIPTTVLRERRDELNAELNRRGSR